MRNLMPDADTLNKLSGYSATFDVREVVFPFAPWHQESCGTKFIIPLTSHSHCGLYSIFTFWAALCLATAYALSFRSFFALFLQYVLTRRVHNDHDMPAFTSAHGSRLWCTKLPQSFLWCVRSCEQPMVQWRWFPMGKGDEWTLGADIDTLWSLV